MSDPAMLVDTNAQPIGSAQKRRYRDLSGLERFVQRYLSLIIALLGAFTAVILTKERTEDALRRITVIETKQDDLATKRDLARVEAQGEYLRSQIDYLIRLQITKK